MFHRVMRMKPELHRYARHLYQAAKVCASSTACTTAASLQAAEREASISASSIRTPFSFTSPQSGA